MRFFFSIIAFIVAIHLQAQPSLSWAKQFGGPSFNESASVTVDASGNVYTTGRFDNTVDFDPGAGVFNLTATGTDVFISKLDASGNFVWAKSFSGSGSALGYSITVDAAGNVYTTGIFEGITDFDPGAGVSNLTATGSGTYDVFISKLDVSGNFVWANKIGSANSEASNSIAVDEFGNVFTTGDFFGTVDFDPGAGVFNLTASGGDYVFISKLDASGNFVWAKAMGGMSGASGTDIALDGTGNIYITGIFAGTVDFDPNAGTSNVSSAGDNDIFISKLDASGNFIWAKALGGSGAEYAPSIVLDAIGNVITTGGYSATADFDPGILSFNLTSNGFSDIFVSKLDASGNFVWAQSVGGSYYDHAYSIAVDASGNTYLSGGYANTVDFDPGAGLANLTWTGGTGTDIFVLKLDDSGNYVWAASMGGTNDDEGIAIILDESENIYLAGGFAGTCDFNPGTGALNYTSVGSVDAYVLKLAPCSGAPSMPTSISGNSTICSGSNNTYSIAAVSGATSYNWTLPSGWSGSSTTNSITTTANSTSGNITVTATNSCGTSSAQTLAVTVNTIPSTPGTISGTSTICSGSTNTYSIAAVSGATSYTWTLPSGWSGTSTTNSITTTASATSGNITVTADNSCGSSSAASLVITVNTIPTTPGIISGANPICAGTTSNYSVLAVSGATSYTWTLPSGWSGTSSTNLINAIANSTSGNITVTANNGCGNSAASTLAIVVNPLPNVGLILPTDMLCEYNSPLVLSGGTPSGGIYSGTGVSSGNFDPAIAGLGTFTITYTFTDANSCTISATDNIVVDACLGMNENENDLFSVYPNPTDGIINILSDSPSSTIKIYNAIGEFIYTSQLNSKNTVIDIRKFESGIYFIQLVKEGVIFTKKIVKE